MGNSNKFYVDIMSVHNEVTGSCNLCILKLPNRESIRFVVDCGLFQEHNYNDMNFEPLPFKAENLDFAILTHNHVDHNGRFPLLYHDGFMGKIYTTDTTAKLLPLSLYDSVRVLRDLAKRKNVKCLYSETDVEKTLAFVEPCFYNKAYRINEYVKVTFFCNGHLPGAALVLVQASYPGYEDINILFTGDYHNHNMFFDVPPLPKWVLELPLTIVQESTYGDMESHEIEKTFSKNIIHCMNNNGTALCLVFSLGRAQEILYVLKQMQQTGELSTEIPIYLDGKLSHKYTNLYIRDGLNLKNEMRDFLPENFEFVDDNMREKLLEDTDKKIILTSSGMGNYGPAQVYIPTYISRKNALIHFTGFCAEGTLGATLQKTQKSESVTVGGLITKKRALVQSTTEFSAHAKSDEMIDFLKQFKNLKLVLINHGETETKKIFAEKILDANLKIKNIGILDREYFFRVNPYGLIKTLSTKFK